MTSFREHNASGTNAGFYAIGPSGHTYPAISFRDNDGGDLGWILGANDRGGPTHNGGNCLMWWDVAPANASGTTGDGWNTWIDSSNPFTGGYTASRPTDANLRFGFYQEQRVSVNLVDPPSYTLHVNCTFYSSGSSIEYKKDIKDYQFDIDNSKNVDIYEYLYKEEHEHLGKRLLSGKQIGMIAEEVAEHLPEIAMYHREDDKDVVRNVDYEKLSVCNLSMFKQLEDRLSKLEEEV